MSTITQFPTLPNLAQNEIDVTTVGMPPWLEKGRFAYQHWEYRMTGGIPDAIAPAEIFSNPDHPLFHRELYNFLVWIINIGLSANWNGITMTGGIQIESESILSYIEYVIKLKLILLNLRKRLSNKFYDRYEEHFSCLSNYLDAVLKCFGQKEVNSEVGMVFLENLQVQKIPWNAIIGLHFPPQLQTYLFDAMVDRAQIHYYYPEELEP